MKDIALLAAILEDAKALSAHLAEKLRDLDAATITLDRDAALLALGLIDGVIDQLEPGERE